MVPVRRFERWRFVVSKVNGVRLSEDVSEWLERYAVSRGVDKGTVLRTAVEAFKDDCERGVPELREAARKQASLARDDPRVGVGDCPKRPGALGHVWVSWRVDPRKSCEFCGMPGRDNVVLGESGGFFGAATAARSGLIGELRFPGSANGKVKVS